MSSDVNPNVTVLLQLDDSQFNRVVEQVNQNLRNSAMHWEATLNLWQKAFDGITKALGVLKEWSLESAKNAQEQARFTTALEATGRAYAGLAAQIQEANVEKERTLGIDADNLVQIQRYLLQLGVLPERLEFATRATIGLADATGKDLQSAATTVGKFLEGNVASLTKLGFNINTYEEGLVKLQQTYDQKLKQQESDIVQTEKLSAAFGNLKENIGGITSAMFGGGAAIGWMAEKLATLNDWLAKTNELGGGWRGRWEWLTKGSVTEALPLDTGPQFDMRTGFGAGLGAVQAPLLAPGQSGWDPAKKKGSTKTPTPFKWNETGGSVSTIMEQFQQLNRIKLEMDTQMARLSLELAADTAKEMSEIETRAQKQRERNQEKELLDKRSFFEKLFNLSVVRAEREKQINQTVQAGYESLANIAISGISNMISGAIQAAVSGQGELGKIIKSMFGSLLTQVGQTMLQLSVIWGILAIVTADPVLGARAAALGVAGVASIALGSALGGSGAGGPSSAGVTSSARSDGRVGRNRTIDSATAARRAGGASRGALPSGFSGAYSTGGNTITNVYNVQFGNGVMVAGSKEEAGRSILELLRRAKRLE